MTLVYFDGGQRDGHVQPYDDEELAATKVLLFDGPEWVGVYERSARGLTRITKQGSAEVWCSLS